MHTLVSKPAEIIAQVTTVAMPTGGERRDKIDFYTITTTVNVTVQAHFLKDYRYICYAP